MMPPPEGNWGMPPEVVATLPGYGADVEENRAEARKIMERPRLRPGQALKVKVSTRNIPLYRDPAVILIDQLKKIHVEGELDVDRHQRVVRQGSRGEYTVGLNLAAPARRSRRQVLRELRLRLGAQLHQVLQPRGREADRPAVARDRFAKRRAMVWEIEKHAGQGRRAADHHPDVAGLCWQPHVKNFVLHHNSIYNNWRFDDVWLDK